MRGRPREFDRDEVLDRAMQLFWDHGYEGTAVSDLVEHLGIGRQSLYSTFGDKRRLFDEALSRYAETELQTVIAMLDGPGPPLGNIQAVMQRWQEMAESGHKRGCLFGNTAAELAAHDEELAQRLAQQFRRLEDAFARALRRAKKEGELSEDKDPRALARFIVTLSQGLAATSAILRPAYVRDVISTAADLLR